MENCIRFLNQIFHWKIKSIGTKTWNGDIVEQEYCYANLKQQKNQDGTNLIFSLSNSLCFCEYAFWNLDGSINIFYYAKYVKNSTLNKNEILNYFQFCILGIEGITRLWSKTHIWWQCTSVQDRVQNNLMINAHWHPEVDCMMKFQFSGVDIFQAKVH